MGNYSIMFRNAESSNISLKVIKKVSLRQKLLGIPSKHCKVFHDKQFNYGLMIWTNNESD